MTNELALLVHPIIRRALALCDRLERGEIISFEVEHAALKGLLLTQFEAQRVPEFGGEPWRADNRSPFLGVRYALACWLDELFAQTSWADLWRERPLEAALYGTRDGAGKFWEQARKAETRANADALEAFFVCVMLGFRGEWRQQLERLRQWLTTAQARLTSAQSLQWRGPAGLEPDTHLPRLGARQSWYNLVLAAALILLAAVPAATFFLVGQLGR